MSATIIVLVILLVLLFSIVFMLVSANYTAYSRIKFLEREIYTQNLDLENKRRLIKKLNEQINGGRFNYV